MEQNHLTVEGSSRNLTVSVPIAAPAARVHAVLVDVDRWPEWLPTVISVNRRASGPMRVGERVDVRQPRLPAARWEVIRLVPDQGFTWVARSPGIATEARHEIEPIGGGEVLLTLGIRHGGPLARVLGPLTAALTRRYIATEAVSVKARAEAASHGAGEPSKESRA